MAPPAHASGLGVQPGLLRGEPPGAHTDQPTARVALPPVVAGLAALTAPLPYMRRPVTRAICRGLMLAFGPLLEVEHGERLAALREPAIFALNHGNASEALLVPAALMYLRRGRPLHFLADWMYVEAPVLGWLLRLSEPIPVYNKPARFRLREAHRRERRRQPVLAACLAHLARGESVGFFPEGTRNRDEGGGLLRGRLGLGELALAAPAAVPVVPAAIRYPARARLGRAPLLGRLVLSIGEPLDFTAERRRLAAAPESRRGLAREVVDRVMAALGAALDDDPRSPLTLPSLTGSASPQRPANGRSPTGHPIDPSHPSHPSHHGRQVRRPPSPTRSEAS
jgi:1-acyl-sn-glycerol-3-phosphate acyltransferase